MNLPDRVRLASAFGRSLVAHRLHLRPRPFSASVAVTNRCNLHCRYCDFPRLDRRQLDTADLTTVFGRLARLGVRRLGLVGGEPLLRADLPDLIAAARDLGLFVSVNTNLTLHARHPERLRGAQLVFTSLDGGPDAHRANRGDEGPEPVLAAIRRLRARGVPVIAIFVVTAHNLDDAGAVLDLAAAEGFRVHFQPRCEGAPVVRADPGLDADSAALRALFRDLAVARARGAPVASSAGYLASLARWEDFRVSAVDDPTTRCAAGTGFLFVDPQGRAWPCAFTQGVAEPVDLLRQDWARAFSGDTPCTRCAVGPYVEFNALFRHPAATSLALARSYG